jgi:pimeloyl-ACP methyl ester carboxylesterase
VFVHGLRFANAAVWLSSSKPPEVWPSWLAGDIPNLAVWSYEHDSVLTLWRGWSMPLVDRAANALATILTEERLRQGDIALVAHSFGGLICQQMLRTASDRAVSEPDLAELVHRISRVMFLGTPHVGADLATWAGILRFIVRPSFATQGLSRNDPNLRGLNQWFRRYAPEHGIATKTLTESRRTRFGLIVKPDSADPGLPAPAIPVDADHFGIASPKSKDSEVYRQVRDFLKEPTPSSPRRTLIASDALDTIGANSTRSTAAIERIEQRLSMGASAEREKPRIPAYLVDAETSKRVTRLRRMRFFGGSTHLEEASRLARELLNGELEATSPAVKAHALAWCARLLLARPDRSEALSVLNAARALAATEEVTVAEAFKESYEGRHEVALGILSGLGSSTARSAAFIVISNNRDANQSLDWLRDSGLSFSDLDSDGKFFVIKRQLDAGKTAGALQNANTLGSDDFENTPVLLYVAGGAHLAQATPPELVSLILWHLPFDAAPFPLFDDAVSMTERRTARDLYRRASEAARSVGCVQASQDASDRVLWLGLRDPLHRNAARADLEKSMRDPAQALRRFPLALQFGLRLDLEAVEKEIDRQDTLSGGNSPEVAIARFSMAFTKKDPREVSAYIDKHRPQLLRNLNPLFITSVEIQMLARSGQIELAEARYNELTDPNIGGQERARLLRIIAEARGTNPVEARERQFKDSNALTDLANLVELLETQRDWPRLVTYGEAFFERTRDLAGCRVYAQALFETADFKGVVELLSQQQDLLERSHYLHSLLAWALYRIGNVKECRKALADLRSKRDDAGDRVLVVNLAIVSGDWTSLAAFVEQEWEKRGERSAEELLRAGQLAQQIGSARARDLIFEAASKANGNAAILVGCYSAAISAGWEDDVTAAWLQQGAALSGEHGPIKQVSMKELFDMQPNWQRREAQTWENLHKGMMPMFAAAYALNRSLIDFYLLPALSNSERVDPRRRSLLYAYSGARGFVQGEPRKALLEPTALLTLGAIGALDEAFAAFDKIVLPHNTLGWLFEERQRVQFHQPTKIAEAHEIKLLLDTRALQRFEATARPNNELAAEVGDELAALFAEAEADFGDDHRQRIVVRSSPVHRLGSLMEEEADLGDHAAHVCGCLQVVEALARQSQLTQTEEQRARAYLALQEKPWAVTNTIQAGAVLYLDELSVSYLQHLRLLSKIHAAGFACIIPPSEVSQGDRFIAYENLVGRAITAIENIRRVSADGIASGKVALAPEIKIEDEDNHRIKQHPTFDVLEAGTTHADVVIIDDRYFNQHGRAQGTTATVPLWTTFDLLTWDKFDPIRRRDYVTSMRRAGLGFVPTSSEELNGLIQHARIEDGRLVETAELKAFRESLQLVRMSAGLQLPTENPWFENVIRTLLDVIRAQWSAEIDDATSRTRSNWLLEQLDIRQWANHYRIEGHPEISGLRFRGQILALGMITTSVPRAVKDRYWQWVEDAVLEKVKEEQPELFAEVVQHVKSIINEASKEGAGGGSDGG